MTWAENFQLAWDLLPRALTQTCYMVVASTFFACLIGLPLGVFLWHFRRRGAQGSYRFLSTLVNIGRSVPFAILMVALIPVTRWIVGTSLGTTASIVPLTIAAAPFFARLVERALQAVGCEIVDAALVMGSTEGQIVCKVLLPEALPSLVSAVTLTMVNLIGYSAMAGLIGGGGLGQIAIQYGYQRFNTFLMIATLILLLLLVECVEYVGKGIVYRLEKKRGLRG